jgi:hypothetical protein
MSLTLSEFQKSLLREISLADRNETSLRNWIAAGGLDEASAIVINRRMRELRQPSQVGAPGEEPAADFLIAVAAGLLFTRLQQDVHFGEAET